MKPLKLYTVLVPVTVAVSIVFESDEDLTDEQAFDIAVDKGWTVDASKSGEDPGDTFDVSINEWQVHDKVNEGNKYNGVIDHFDVESEDIEILTTNILTTNK
jgi:hypothetical protein